MTPPKSPRGEARRRQAANRSREEHGSSSEDEDSFSHQNSSRNCSPRNTSDYKYFKVSPRPGLGHHSDLNSSAETDTRNSKFNTSTSSELDSPDKAVARGASKSPGLYPDLEVTKESSKYSPHKDVVGEALLYPNLTPYLEEIEESSTPVEVSSNKTFALLVAVFLVILAASLAIWMFMPINKSAEPVDNPVPPFDRFTGNISNLQQVFPNQNKRLWRTVKASARHVLDDAESDYPVVILMASPTKHAHIAKCIAKKIAENFELSLNLTPVESVADIGQMRHLDPASQKQQLDEDLNSAFSSKQRKSFVIDNLQLLHPEAALMLHGYCDNDNAPFKDVMMVLLLYINQNEDSDYSNAFVEDYLEQLWSRGLDVDKVKALLSRVANNIVTVEVEDEETFSKVCSWSRH